MQIPDYIYNLFSASILLYVFSAYLFLINLIGFIIMGIDKSKARKNHWRISEKMLFSIALLLGSPGCILGMYTFRHKTRHWYFVVGMPLILLCQIAIAFYAYRYLK